MAMVVTAAQILGERTRTIDQVKRLYAVVMGYAVTTCFSNIYACAKVLGFDLDTPLLALLAQGLTLISLATLFYLGSERLLDTRYLGPDSPVPSRHGLLFDLASLGLTAGWFVILADTFPIAPATPYSADAVGIASKVAFTAQVFESQMNFTHNLIVLYLIDLVFLVGQIIRLTPEPSDPRRRRTRNAHWIWLLQNIICAWLFWHYRWDWWLSTVDWGWITLNKLSLALIVVHFVRFIFDFCQTFEFYYPSDHLPTS